MTDSQPAPVTTPALATVTTPALATADVTRLRDLVIRAHPDAVPELITGVTLDELEASLATARDVHSRYTSATPTTTAAPQPPPVPAGGAPAPVVDYAALSPAAKIARGLALLREAPSR